MLPNAQEESDDDSSSDSDDRYPEDSNQIPPQKILTYKWSVNSINKSLDENCYDPHDFAVVEDPKNETVLTGFLGPKKNTKTKKICSRSKKPQNARCQRASNILPHNPKPSTLLLLASGIDTMVDTFHMLFADGSTNCQ